MRILLDLPSVISGAVVFNYYFYTFYRHSHPPK
jgi:hypothetical protein